MNSTSRPKWGLVVGALFALLTLGMANSCVQAQVSISQGASVTFMRALGQSAGANMTVHTGATSTESIKVRNQFTTCCAEVQFRPQNGGSTISVTVPAGGDPVQLSLGAGVGSLPVGNYDVYIRCGCDNAFIDCGYIGVVVP